MTKMRTFRDGLGRGPTTSRLASLLIDVNLGELGTRRGLEVLESVLALEKRMEDLVNLNNFLAEEVESTAGASDFAFRALRDHFNNLSITPRETCRVCGVHILSQVHTRTCWANSFREILLIEVEREKTKERRL